MQQVLLSVKNFFNRKYIGIVCLLMAILNKCIIAFFYSSLKADKALYLLFAESFLKTGRLAEPVLFFENGATNYFYDPAVHSPLYSFICAPVLWLTKSYFYTQLIVSCLSWVLFFAALYNLLLLIFKERWITHLFILFAAFFLYPHELISSPKDTWAVAFTLWSVFFAYHFISGKASWQTALWLAFSLSCMAMVKLLYIPLAAVLLAVIIVFIWIRRLRSHIPATALLLGIIVVIGLLIKNFVFGPAYQLAANNAAGLPGNTSIIVKGLYLQNLLTGFPFITSSFINTHMWAVQAQMLSVMSFQKAMQVFFTTDAVLLLALVALIIFFFRTLIRHTIFLVLLLLSLSMTTALIYLSVTQKILLDPALSDGWTFISDARSFLIPMLSLQITAFVFVFKMRKLSFLRYTILALFFITAAHGAYFTAKCFLSKPATQEANVYNDALKHVTDYLKNEKAKGQLLRLATTDKDLRRYAQMQYLPTYTFSQHTPDYRWMKSGDRFLIATRINDSVVLKRLPQQSMALFDTIPPFVLHIYTHQ